jgi:hypothetical protein
LEGHTAQEERALLGNEAQTGQEGRDLQGFQIRVQDLEHPLLFPFPPVISRDSSKIASPLISEEGEVVGPFRLGNPTVGLEELLGRGFQLGEIHGQAKEVRAEPAWEFFVPSDEQQVVDGGIPRAEKGKMQTPRPAGRRTRMEDAVLKAL